MSKWIAEFELEDGDTMPEHMDLEYKGARIDFHCKPLEQEPTTKNDLGVENDLVSTITEKISEQVTESHEAFIFETIRPYCENVVQMKISKRDLEQALLKYYGKNDLGVDCISREDVLMCLTGEFENREYELSELIKIFSKRIKALPSVTPQEPQAFKWCTDCKEYDQEKHCCHRYSKVIRDAVAEIEQEPILDKINKMKSEIADSLEFWDYSPNNNPLARDMLETLTNFWGDMRGRGMMESTGYKDRYGNDICVGDYVKFRAKGITGRGIVFKPTDEEIIQRFGEYMIQDTRKYPECKRRNEGSQYPFYDDAVYTVLAESEDKE